MVIKYRSCPPFPKILSVDRSRLHDFKQKLLNRIIKAVVKLGCSIRANYPRVGHRPVEKMSYVRGGGAF